MRRKSTATVATDVSKMTAFQLRQHIEEKDKRHKLEMRKLRAYLAVRELE